MKSKEQIDFGEMMNNMFRRIPTKIEFEQLHKDIFDRGYSQGKLDAIKIIDNISIYDLCDIATKEGISNHSKKRDKLMFAIVGIKKKIKEELEKT